MFSLLAASDFTDAISLCKTFGPLFVAVVWFLFRDWKREDRLSSRIDELEDQTLNILMPLVKDCTACISRNTQVMDRLENYLNGTAVRRDV